MQMTVSRSEIIPTCLSCFLVVVTYGRWLMGGSDGAV